MQSIYANEKTSKRWDIFIGKPFENLKTSLEARCPGCKINKYSDNGIFEVTPCGEATPSVKIYLDYSNCVSDIRVKGKLTLGSKSRIQ